MKKSEKEQVIAEVSETVSRSTAMYFTDFSGLTVEQATELRRELRKAGIEYRVVKNTLIKKALEQVSGYDKVYDKLVGPTGVAFSFDDAVVPAKVIDKFIEKHHKLSLKAAVLEKQVYDGAKLKEIARLPSKKELMANILGSIQAPLAGVPTVINAVLRDLVSVVDEVGKKKAA
ncbi:MAG: 50S ribosomal protein L10 [Ignavibacteriae bacterium]|nr:50S ribosomal protein L10 [Ignavibacteriota bacterium]